MSERLLLLCSLSLVACRPEPGGGDTGKTDQWDTGDSITTESDETDTGGGADSDTKTDTSGDSDSTSDTHDETATETATETGQETGDDTAPEIIRDPISFDMGADADAKLFGEDVDDYTNELTLGRGGDLNGDGFADLVLGTQWYSGDVRYSGRAYVVFGPVTGSASLADADRHFEGEFNQGLGISIGSAGDTDGDGVDDLIIGQASYNSGGRAVVVLGPMPDTTDIDEAGTAFLYGEDDGSSCGSDAGASVNAAGDVNDDGFDDLVVGATRINLCATLGGGYVVYGPVSGDIQLGTDAAMRIHDASYGGEIAGAGDANGDGFDDVIIGVLRDTPAALLFLGPTSGDVTAADADTSFNAGDGQVAGWKPAGAGDINADGYEDLIIDDPANSDDETFAGQVFVVYGPVASGEVELSTADAKLLGPAENVTAGWDLDGPGDVNADGFDDILVGAPGHVGADAAGTAYLVLGPVYGELMLDGADVTFNGEGAGDYAGDGVVGAGDVDGDGLPDLLIGGTGDDEGGEYAGAAWLFYAANLW